LSGLYDLEPLRHTHINEWIQMDAATALRNAPINNPPVGSPAIVLAAGEREQPAFHEQTRRYAERCRAWGRDARILDAPGDDHFSIVLSLGDSTSRLSRALRALSLSR
jgi:arylformamidase